MWVTLAAASRYCRWLAITVVWGTLCTTGCASKARAQTADAGTPEAESAVYGARAHITAAPKEGKAFSGGETRALEHSMGPSFSIVESLPGVVPVFSGVPYIIVRGATPAGSVNFYDGVALPALFHLALGPSVINPNLLGELHFFPGVARPRYGARIGAVVDQDGPRPNQMRDATRVLELSLLETSGYMNVPTQDGSLSVAWRYGNPGLILSALQLRATLSYYDYQVRYETALSSHTRLLLLALGDGDQLGDPAVPKDDIALSFHRIVGRITHQVHDFELGAQLVLGVDDSTLGDQLSGHALRAQPNLYTEWRKDSARLRVGIDMSAALAKLTHGARPVTNLPNTLRNSRITLDPQDFLDGQPFASMPTRDLVGMYADLHLQPASRLSLDLGFRADAWFTGARTDTALSPSIALRYGAARWLEFRAGLALAHKPRTSPLPIPGLNDVALDAGVETVVQSEAGAVIRLGDDTQLETTFFYHRYLDVVYLELILDCQGNTDPAAAQALLTRQDPLASICRRSGLPTADGESHGGEVFLKRNLSKKLSGFVSYTLAHATATARDGTRFTPQSDVRHLLNAVLRYEFGDGFALGLRLHYRTGKMAVNTFYDLTLDRFQRVEFRLPSFLRLDLRASYAWRVSFGRLEASIGLQNATFSEEATHRDCVPMENDVLCTVHYQPYIVLPNVGLRADF